VEEPADTAIGLLEVRALGVKEVEVVSFIVSIGNGFSAIGFDAGGLDRGPTVLVHINLLAFAVL